MTRRWSLALATMVVGVWMALGAPVSSQSWSSVILRSSGGTELATPGAPLRVDPTGSTTQPVSGSVTANAGSGTFTVSGTVTANAGTGNFTVVQGTGTNLHVVCDSGCSSSSAPADASTFTPGTTSQTPIGGFFQTTATSNALTTGQMGAFQVTAQRALFTNLRNASGTEIGTSTTPVQVSLANTAANATAVKVDGSAVTQPVSGTFWQATQPTSIADGSDVTLGAQADAAVTTSATGTISGKLRGIISLLNSGITVATHAVTQSGTWTVQPGNTQNTTAWLTQLYDGTNKALVDPCAGNAKSYASVNQTTTTQILGLSGSSKRYYICSIHLVTATAQNVGLIDSTTANNACATSPSGSDGFGGTTTGTWNFAANGGIAYGNGASALGQTHNTNAALCVYQSSTGQVSGGFSYVTQ